VDFEVSRKSRDYLGRLGAFMDEHVYPNEERYYLQPAGSRWDDPPFLQDLQHKARAAGLWNLFLPDSQHGAGLTNLEGHRSVGGMRASIYNAMPLAGVQALIGFMKEFQRRNG